MNAVWFRICLVTQKKRLLCYLYFARRLVHATGKYSMVRLCVCIAL